MRVTMESSEQIVWKGSPSQLVNAPTFIVCALLFWLVVPIFIALWKWLVVHNIQYALTSERLKMRQGVLNKQFDELELYRVRDYRLEQPFWLRIFALGNIIVRTTDTTHPLIVLRAIQDGESVLELVRHNVETCRAKKNVRALDLE